MVVNFVVIAVVAGRGGSLRRRGCSRAAWPLRTRRNVHYYIGRGTSATQPAGRYLALGGRGSFAPRARSIFAMSWQRVKYIRTRHPPQRQHSAQPQNRPPPQYTHSPRSCAPSALTALFGMALPHSYSLTTCGFSLIACRAARQTPPMTIPLSPPARAPSGSTPWLGEPSAARCGSRRRPAPLPSVRQRAPTQPHRTSARRSRRPPTCGVSSD